MTLRKFIIERDIPAAGPRHSMGESYVAADKTFCVYLAKDEDVIKEHAKLSGFPATKVTEVRKMIDPTTEHAA